MLFSSRSMDTIFERFLSNIGHDMSGILKGLFGAALIGGSDCIARVSSHNQHYNTAWLRTTALFGSAAAAAVAVRMFLAQEAGAEIGAMHALYLNRLFAFSGALCLIGYCLFRQKKLLWPSGSLKRLVIAQAVLETGALGVFLIGSANGGRIGATKGFSAFAAATTFFAWIWLGERIGWQRGGCIAIVSLGIILAIVGSPTIGS